MDRGGFWDGVIGILDIWYWLWIVGYVGVLGVFGGMKFEEGIWEWLRRF